MAQVTLGQVLDQLRKIGSELDEVMDYSGIAPDSEHHRTAVFIRLPHPELAKDNGEVFERLARFVQSINRPDTIKCDVYTVIGKNVVQGFNPHTELTAKGDFDPDQIHAILNMPYVLQVVVDVVQPQALQATIEALNQ